MYETVEITNKREFQITTFFDGLKIELCTLIEDDPTVNGERAFSSDLYIYNPDPDKNWVNIWALVEFSGRRSLKPKLTIDKCDVDVSDLDENEQNEYRELLKKWLKDPQFIEKINDMAKKLAIYI